MNERIQELYKQANAQARQNACTKNNTLRPQNNTVWNEFVPLFAELIVRECINCCDEVDRINEAFIQDYDYDPQNGPKECIQVIKEHFGVEE